MYRLFHVLLGVLIMAGTVASAATLKCGDGLSLELSGAGRVTAVNLGKTSLPLTGDGGFAIADFKNQPEPVNLVPNPGFEEGQTNWRLGAGQHLDTTIFHSGQTSARLEVPGPAPASSNLEVVVPVKPNTRYKVGLWLRRHNVGVTGVYSSERDDQNKLTGKMTQVGVSVPKQDDVWLPLSWEIVTQPQTTRLSLRGDIYQSTGTLWLDDFFVYEMGDLSYSKVGGILKTGTNGMSFSGALRQNGLQVQATLKGEKDCLRVDGVVSDITGQDRAIGLRFVLPVNLKGWTWFDDAEERQVIDPAMPPYRNTYNCVSGTGQCSVYPWSTAVGPRGAVSLALPLSQGPRTFLLEARPEGLCLTFFYGLTKDAERNPNRAPFSFVIYAPEAHWGMRSAMERYYRLFPESFVKRPTFDGYLNYADLERFDPQTHNLIVAGHIVPDASDWGEGYKFLQHVHGCYDYRQVPYDDPKLPSDEIVFGLLQQMVEQEKGTTSSYVPTSETIKKICLGPKGEIEYIGDTKYWRAQEGYNHTDKPGWGFNFRVNEDPDISPYLMNRDRAKAEAYSKTEHRPWDGTFTADAIEGYMANSTALDYRREHFRTTLSPLSFGKDTLEPAIINDIWDFHKKAWWPITNQYQIATYGNSNSYEQAFTLPFVDIPMTEGEWDPQHPGRLDRYLRGMAHHKIWRYWHAWDASGGYGDKDPNNVQRQFNRCVASGIFPPVYSIEAATADLEQWRARFRQFLPVIEELSAAGWEPVPYATATNGVVVERFGSFAKGTLHFTLSPEKATDSILTLNRTALGIPAKTQLVAISATHPSVVEALQGDSYKLASLAPDDPTVALWVGTPLQAAQNGFRLAAATLQKLDRMYYQEMTPSVRAQWQAALNLAQEGTHASTTRCLELSVALQRAVASLQQALITSNPIDLAKLTYRICTQASEAPIVLLGLTGEALTPIEQALPGQLQTDKWTLSNRDSKTLTQLQPRIVSPWAELATRSSMQVRTRQASGPVVLPLILAVPDKPERSLLPYLLQLAGKAGDTPFLISTPVDVVVGQPLRMSVQPQRVFRGESRKLMLIVESMLSEPATIRLKLTPPAKTSLDMTEMMLTLPARGTAAQQPIVMTLQPTAFLGEARIGYTLTSDDVRLNAQGTIEITISDPVPQLPIKRTATPPTIDGKLDDAVWQVAPLVPELHLLTNGAPASEKTAVWAAYDDNGLYLAMRCQESQMDKLVAKLTDRGAPLYQDDDVEVFIAIYSQVMTGLVWVDTSKVFQFAVNANGAQSDNFGNKADWRAAAQKEEKDWTVEIFIPYGAIGQQAPPPAGLPWGVQFGRQQKPKGETTSWTKGPSFISRDGFGEIVFE